MGGATTAGARRRPAGATTNSDAGVTDIRKTYKTLEAMQREGLLLLVHGEVTSPDGILFKVSLVLDGDKLTGEVAATQNGETMMKGKMELARVKS